MRCRAADEEERRHFYLQSAEAYRRVGGAAAGDLSADQRRDPVAALGRPRAGRGDRRARCSSGSRASPTNPRRLIGAPRPRPRRCCCSAARDEARARARGGGGGGAAGLGGPCLDASPVPRHPGGARRRAPPGSICCGRRVRSIIRRSRRRWRRAGGDRGRSCARRMSASASARWRPAPELVAAEALLARGRRAPRRPARRTRHSFAARFVDPFGADWRARFDAALAAAESVELSAPARARPRCAAARARRRDRAWRRLAQRRAADGRGAARSRRRGADRAPSGRAGGSRSLRACCCAARGQRRRAADAGFEDRLGEVRDALAQAGSAGASRPISAAMTS